MDISNISEQSQKVGFSRLPAIDRGVREHKQSLPTAKGGTSSYRSIIDNAKQWVGGAVFGLVIFAGILISQQGEEEPLPTYSEAHLVGVSMN